MQTPSAAAVTVLLAAALAVLVGPAAAQTTASFEVEPQDPVAGETVTLRSTSTGEYGDIVSWEWRVDGEVVGETETIEYSFDEAGDHLVALTVRDQEHQGDTTERTITVAEPNQPPNASLAVTPRNATVGEQVTVDATASSDPGDGLVARYAFDIDGDGADDVEDAGEGRVTHSYEEPGEYRVRVTVMDDDGATATANATVTVTRPALTPSTIAGFTANVSDVRAGESVGFDAGALAGNASYEWRIDGEAVSNQRRFEHAFDEAGDHSVGLTVTLPGGANASATETVTVAPRNGTENATGNAGVNATLLDAIDADDDGRIGDQEVLEAISYWNDDAAVPGTDGVTLDDIAVLRVIEAWRTGAAVPG